MTGAGPHAPAAQRKRQAGLVRYTSSQRSPRASRLAARHSGSQASHASTNASDARRRRKSPWLGNFPNSPTSTGLPTEDDSGPLASFEHSVSWFALELPPVMRGERIARGVRRFDHDLNLMECRMKTECRVEIGFLLRGRG